MKKIFTFLLIAFMSGIVNASIPIGNFEYTVLSESRREMRVCGPRKGMELSGDIVIPATVVRPSDGMDYDVVEIGPASGNIREDYVWDPPFYNQTGITSVTIPETVTNIYNDAFTGCTGIKEYKVKSGNPVYTSSDGIIYKKDRDGEICTLFRFPPASPLTTFNVPENPSYPEKVIELWFGAFRDNENLKTLNLGESGVVAMGVFVGNRGISTMTSEGDDRYNILNDGMILSSDGENLLLVAPACSSGKFVIPASVKKIGRYACASLQCSSVDFSNVVEIDNQGFYGAALTEVTVPTSVKTLGYAVFEECRELESAVIESRVKCLPGALFRHCEKLTEVKLPTSCTGLDGRVFFGCKSLQIFSLANYTKMEKENTVSDYHFAFSGITKMNWPSKVTAVPANCFFKCTEMREIKLNETTEEIKDYSFYGTGLESFYSRNVGKIGDFAFEAANSLQKIVLAETDRPLLLGYQSFPVNKGAEIFINHKDLQMGYNPDYYTWVNGFYGDLSSGIFYTSSLSSEYFFNRWDRLYVPWGAEDAYRNFRPDNNRIYEMFCLYYDDNGDLKVKPNYDWVVIKESASKNGGLDLNYTVKGVEMHTFYPDEYVSNLPTMVNEVMGDSRSYIVAGREIRITRPVLKVIVSDVSGKVCCISDASDQETILLPEGGIYIISVTNSKGTKTDKIIVK